jgi:hypothetical protein
MAFGEEKIKGFFQDKTEKMAAKVEKTPMKKFFVFFLILISISAVVLGYMQLKQNIEGPAMASYLDRKRGELIEKYKTSTTTTEDELVSRLKSQDSDLDGLDDWSEINVYATSPYLSDTDNDGLSDKQEITQGTNPNCPEGIDCSAVSTISPVAGNEGTNSNIEAVMQTLSDGDLQTLMTYEQDLLAGKVTLSQLGIDNPALQQLFDQMKTAEVSDLGNLNADDKTAAVSDLKQMTPAQLREELIKRGMDKATLDQIDDQTLNQLLDQIISTYK